MTPVIVPQDWQDVLKQIQIVFPSAIIAGGALRDLWHDKPIKDVDVFIPVSSCPDDLYAEVVKSIDPQAILINTSIYGQTATGDPTGLRYIHCIWSLLIKGTIYELIFIQDIGKDELERFDINICQIGYNGTTVYYTHAFYSGIKDKTLRVCNVNRSDRQTKRLERIASKYPEYKIEPYDDDEIPF